MQKQVPGLQKDSSFSSSLHIKQITSKHLPISLQEKTEWGGKRGRGGRYSKLFQLDSSLAISCTQIPMLSLSNSTKQTVLMVEDMVATKQVEMALRISWAAVCFGKPFLTEKNTLSEMWSNAGIHYVRGRHTGQYYTSLSFGGPAMLNLTVKYLKYSKEPSTDFFSPFSVQAQILSRPNVIFFFSKPLSMISPSFSGV